MTTIKILGVCCSTECSKRKLGKCQNYRPNDPDDEKCKYCMCDAGAHTLLHYEVVPNAPVQTPVAPPVKKLTGGPALQQRKLLKEERARIFATASPASSTPSKKKSKPEVVDMTTEEVKKPKTAGRNTEEDRNTDRAEALRFAPEGMTKTDLDMGHFYKVNGEWWMPPVTDVDPITDYCCRSALMRGKNMWCNTYRCVGLSTSMPSASRDENKSL